MNESGAEADRGSGRRRGDGAGADDRLWRYGPGAAGRTLKDLREAVTACPDRLP
ncbi:hypothetical protein TPA0910_50310 [Streptomyces hygroscopicus subsp. sporocinereus]|uniref:Uncharacterized protein n=1 Tax=Streptomyces hygroscopicus TaxID=1912 RepID=A0ABQ3U4R7_STRHY|nr:hypothetical protein TPA0910_50310 [Streptomyces hygroscopicus]